MMPTLKVVAGESRQRECGAGRSEKDWTQHGSKPFA
jgi:hypothetical protein